MKLEKKIKNFFTLIRKADAGFTLVELIVVIAILAILGGTGVAGYSGYVKNAGRGADKATVGNIIRAAECGSYLFALDDPLQMGGEGLSLPLGFVVLTNEGMSGMESGSELETFVPEGTPCQILPIGTIPSKEGTFRVLDIPQFKVDKTTIREEHIVYGTKTSPQAYYIEPYVYSGGSTYCYTCSLRNGGVYSSTKSAMRPPSEATFLQWKNNPSSYASGERVREHFIFVDSSKLVTSGCVDGEPRPVESYDKDNVSVTTDGTIAQMLQMAFGNDYQNVKLQGDWSPDSLNNTLPTLYANADSLLTDLERMIGNALTDENFSNLMQGNIDKVMETYLPEIADRYANSFTKEQYLSAWENLANDSGPTNDKRSDLTRWGGYFGYSESELFNATAFQNKAGYMAGVGAYNAGFASYVRSTTPKSGTHNAESCAGKIIDYGDALQYGTADAFNDAVPVSAATFAEGGNLECPACASLHAQYLENEAWKANAETFYNLMKTVDDTSVKAVTESKIMGQGYMDWYKNYVAEFQNLYGTIDEVIDGAESAIVITFQRNPDSSIGFEVFPAEANPRNK